MRHSADDLAARLTGLLADACRKKLTSPGFGTDQEHALRQAATGAVQRSGAELRPCDDEQASTWPGDHSGLHQGRYGPHRSPR
jgi:hypothetical protein